MSSTPSSSAAPADPTRVIAPLAAAATPELPARIGACYHVLGQLGRGGMAVVYRVRDSARNVELALKQLTIPASSPQFAEVSSLFEREYYTLAELSHPSVIEVYDFGLDEAGPYYTMELLDGGDLTELAPLPYELACALMVQVCSSLSLLHARRLVHRDVTPRNVRRTRAGGAKLIDFGAMVPMGPSAHSVGTPAFIAPEVLHMLALDARTDLFSLGGTLYYALTGHIPFAASAFSDLRRAWRSEPLAPSELIAGIPKALDALVLSLLAIDPARRPRSAFEVMQRLAAIAGVAMPESDDIASAYLAAPPLVGRAAEQRRFRQRLRRALSSQGGGLLFEGSEGLGRSRMLDVCALEAQTAGVTVLRLAGRAARPQAFAGAHRLVEQLAASLPDACQEAARRSGTADLLFDVRADAPATGAARPVPLEGWRLHRPALQAALTKFFLRVGLEAKLLIAADDVERIDDASLALLAALVHGASESQLLIVASLDDRVTAGALPALDMLRSRATRVALSLLGAADVELMFASVFGNVPNLTLVSERIHAIAGGSPGQSMQLAQHLVDTKRVRFSDGQWVLPHELALRDLPANAQEALRHRLDALTPLARRLIEAHAVALDGAWRREDYACVAGRAAGGNLDEAITELLRHDLLASDGVLFTLAQHGTRSWLVSQLTAAESAERHGAVAEGVLASDRHGLYAVRHLLEAAQPQEALDRLSQLLAALPDGVDLHHQCALPVADIGVTLVMAFDTAQHTAREPRLLHEIARQLVGLSLVADNALHRRYGPGWLAQLEIDSGLAEFRVLDPQLPAADRLKLAVDTTLARFTAAPESQRVYRWEQALKHLARYATLSIAIGSRSRDAALLMSLPGKLEPFVALSPLLAALWQNTISAVEMNTAGQSERGLARAYQLYERLQPFVAAQPYIEIIRNAIALAIASNELSQGNPAALQWFEVMDRDPMQQVNAMYLRRLLCIYRGDSSAAEQYRKQAELLAVQATGGQMFAAPLRPELVAQAQIGDLTGLRQVVDAIAELAAREPGWILQHQLAQGFFQQLRGDLRAARQAFERCVEEAPKLDDYTTWIAAAAGYVSALVGLGEHEAAQRHGALALARSRELGIDVEARDLIRELAIAEAKLGDFESASARLDALISARSGAMESHIVADHEARARIAIWAKDPAAPMLIARLTAMQLRLGRSPLMLERQVHLLNEAKLAGVSFQLPPSTFETSVLGTSARPARSEVAASVLPELRRIPVARERAARALKLLNEAYAAPAGRLYLVQDGALRCVASMGVAAVSGLDAFVSAYWSDQMEDTLLTEVVSEATVKDAGIAVASFNEGGVTYRMVTLRCVEAAPTAFVGIAALRFPLDVSVSTNAWEIAAALGSALYELGDAQVVAPDSASLS
jgi:hypothetical protein